MIEISVDARNFGKKKGAGYCVIMNYKNFRWTRCFLAGKLTSNQSELKAFEFALKSIDEKFYDLPVVITTTGRYAPMMLEKNNAGFKREAKSNVDQVNEMRKYFEKFRSVKIVTEQNSVLKELNKDTVISGQELFNKES